jgi:hypothetical protein
MILNAFLGRFQKRVICKGIRHPGGAKVPEDERGADAGPAVMGGSNAVGNVHRGDGRVRARTAVGPRRASRSIVFLSNRVLPSGAAA